MAKNNNEKNPNVTSILSDLNAEVEVSVESRKKAEKIEKEETVTINLKELDKLLDARIEAKKVITKQQQNTSNTAFDNLRNAEIQRSTNIARALVDRPRAVYANIVHQTREHNKEVHRIIKEIITPYERAHRKPMSFGYFATKCPNYELLEMHESDFHKIPGPIMINGRMYYPEVGKKMLIDKRDIDLLREKLRFDPQRPFANTPYKKNSRYGKKVVTADTRNGELDGNIFKEEIGKDIILS